MTLRTYQAPTMAEALTEVKKDLGREAVILHTRTFKVGGMFGVGGRQIVEITASDSSTPTGGSASRLTPRRAAASAVSPAASALAAGTSALPERASGQRAGAETSASGLRNGSKPNPETPVIEVSRVNSPATPAAASPASANFGPRAGRLSTPAELAPASVAVADDLRSELSAIRSLVTHLIRSGTGGNESTSLGLLPDALFDAHARLTAAGVSAQVAASIITPIRNGCLPSELGDPQRVRSAVLEQLERMIRVAASPISARRTAPHTIALLGPTGVGKTTTIAKLAALQRLRHGRRVGLVTADTYRIAAVDQLRTYANIIGLPVRVAGTPAEMERACATLADCDTIFIDTAGRSPQDAVRLDELRDLLKACGPAEKHLVLSMATAESVLERTVERFRPLQPDRLLLTKLDEAVMFGSIANLVASTSLPISFITNGQEVPDQIEPADAARLASLIFPSEARP